MARDAAAPAPPARRLGLRLTLGGAIWVGYLLLVRPAPFDPTWPHALLLLAVLLLVPLGLALAGGSGRLLGFAAVAQLPAAALLVIAYILGQGNSAAVLTLPWLVVAALVAGAGLQRLVRRGLRPLHLLVTDGAMMFLLVGAVWAFADRLGFRPLGFPVVIVLLTAVHFHFAGFVLPVATGLAIRHTGGPAATLAGWGVLVGVPAVAVGITASQLGLGTGTETVAAWTLATAGALVASLHFRLALQPRWPVLASGLWAFAGLSLVGSMAFAALYGARFLVPQMRWLDIAWMQALHGALNAFGFGAAALTAWALVERPFR